MQNLTDNERRVLRSLLTSDYDGSVWADCVNESREPSGLEGRALSAVVGSLAKKGLAHCDGRGRDATITLTAAGIDAAVAAGRGSADTVADTVEAPRGWGMVEGDDTPCQPAPRAVDPARAAAVIAATQAANATTETREADGTWYYMLGGRHGHRMPGFTTREAASAHRACTVANYALAELMMQAQPVLRLVPEVALRETNSTAVGSADDVAARGDVVTVARILDDAILTGQCIWQAYPAPTGGTLGGDLRDGATAASLGRSYAEANDDGYGVLGHVDGWFRGVHYESRAYAQLLDAADVMVREFLRTSEELGRPVADDHEVRGYLNR